MFDLVLNILDFVGPLPPRGFRNRAVPTAGVRTSALPAATAGAECGASGLRVLPLRCVPAVGRAGGGTAHSTPMVF